MNEKATEVEVKDEESFSLMQWVESKPAAFDRQAEFEEHIEPLMKALHQACLRHEFAFFAVVPYTQRANGDTIAASSHHPPSVETTPPEMLMVLSASRRDVNGILLALSGAEERNKLHAETSAEQAREPAEAPASESLH